MRFCRASHEGDWPLHIKTAEDMLPYMFASHKYNYGRYGLFYVHSMTWLGQEILDRFCRGEQSLHNTLVSTMDSGDKLDEERTRAGWHYWNNRKASNNGNVGVQYGCDHDHDR